MSRKRLAFLFLAAFLPALALLLPLRLALTWFGIESAGFSARDVGGSVWNGHLRGTYWRQLPLGEVTVRLQPLPLLRGQRRLAISNDRLAATWVHDGRHGLLDADGAIDIDAAAAAAYNMPEVDLQLIMDNVTVLFRGDECVDATGGLQLDATLTGLADATAPLILKGRPTCSGASAIAEFAPAQTLPPGIDRAEVILQVDGTGDYRLHTTIGTRDPSLRAALVLAGFDAESDGLIRTHTGSLAQRR
jgi:general secretion pathway protein N